MAPPVNCKKCGLEKASDLHMFKECPAIAEFWERVGNTTSDILGLQLQINLSLIILGISSEVTGSARSFLFYAMLLARREICKRWVECSPPSHAEWLSLVFSISRLDRSGTLSRRKKAFWGFLLKWSNVEICET